MSQENVEVVQRFFEANERALKAHWENPRSLADAVRDEDLDPEAREAWGLLHPEVVWNTSEFGTYHGHLEIAAAWDDIFDVADSYAVSVRELVDCGGDQVYAAVDRSVSAKGSGIRATFPLFAVITVRDGLIIQADEYAARGSALEAAGLSE